ncbi:hypothetical protein MiSe_42190 [Microseira wollei NIES-4236]|uniref:Uncharacterized protein n=1 Tax=Microseira wollei NIES-4236 TaxID=2530354 RepID=A0AAV3XF09_9CYAN|nr:hypothetical protein MiSe_42190 [Microseira wollei NIES-4236]
MIKLVVGNGKKPSRYQQSLLVPCPYNNCVAPH